MENAQIIGPAESLSGGPGSDAPPLGTLPAIAPPPPLPTGPLSAGLISRTAAFECKPGAHASSMSAAAGLITTVAAAKVGDEFGLAAPPPLPQTPSSSDGSGGTTPGRPLVERRTLSRTSAARPLPAASSCPDTLPSADLGAGNGGGASLPSAAAEPAADSPPYRDFDPVALKAAAAAGIAASESGAKRSAAADSEHAHRELMATKGIPGAAYSRYLSSFKGAIPASDCINLDLNKQEDRTRFEHFMVESIASEQGKSLRYSAIPAPSTADTVHLPLQSHPPLSASSISL